MKIAIVCCLHGDEKYGLKIAKRLSSHFPFFIGNPLAMRKKKRFIDSDLNRSFPGRKEGNYEERRANYLYKKLRKFDYVIDLHSSSNKCPAFGIITKPNKRKIEFVRRLGLKRVVIMQESFMGGKSLIDFVKCGISIEIGPHGMKENVQEVLGLIHNLDKRRRENTDFFQVIDIIKKEANRVLIKNFQEVKRGDLIASGRKKQFAKKDFIPVLANEKAYKDVLCLACRKVKISQVLKTKRTLR